MRLLYLFSIASFLLIGCNPMEDIGPMDGSGDPDDMSQQMDDVQGEAPDFSLSNLDGNTVKLSDFDDKIVALYFFGSGCPFCIAAGPEVQKIADEFNSNESFAIIGLDTWNGNKSAVKSFQNQAKVSFDLLLNASDVAKDYSTTYDRMLIVDTSTGDIVYKGSKRVSNELSDIKDKLKTLLD